MLGRKMIRDMLANAGSYSACLGLIIIGMTAFLSFSIARDNLILAKQTFYEEQNFADGFIKLAGIPQHQLSRVKRLPGVRQVTGRLVKDVQVYDPAHEETVYLRLVSLDLEETRRLNDFRLLEGESLSDKELRGWLARQFFDANQLEIGKSLEIIADGRLRTLEVAGSGVNPEFVYPLRTAQEIYNNPEQFGIAFLPQSIMWQLFSEMDHVYNDLVFSLRAGYEFEQVKEALDVELDRYGVIEIFPREDQTSHFILQEEIEVINTLATFFPVMILSVAAFIIYLVLKRLVEQQRGQIGILKAFGYSRRMILFHYFFYSLVLAAAGGGLGGLVGMWLAQPLTWLLYEFFHLPEIYAGFSWRYLGRSVLICLLVMGFAGYQGCKAVLRLTPAEAMQPRAPESGKINPLEKIPGFAALLTIQGHMAIRNLSRSRGRTGFIFFGVMISCAMVIFTWALSIDMMPKFMFHQYEEVRDYDGKINLARPLNRDHARREVERLSEIAWVEPMAEVPVTLTRGWNQEDVLLMGLPEDARLYNILDAAGNRVAATDEGLVLSERLAKNLGVSVGATLELESIFLRDEDAVLEVPVIAVVPQYIGMNAYMGIKGLSEMLEQGPLVTSLLVEVKGGDENQRRAAVAGLREHYRESELVAGVDSRWHLLDMMQEYWELAGWILYLYVLIGVGFSCAVIYISSLIVLSERQRELASMRVLGMSSGEVFSVITSEQWLISGFAVLAGIPLAWIFIQGFAREWSTDMYTMPAFISVDSVITGVIITCLAIWLTQRFAKYKIKKLNLTEALKTRE